MSEVSAGTVPDAPSTAAPASEAVAPVSERARFGAIDSVRGFALLGIFLPNLFYFAWPFDANNGGIVLPETGANHAGEFIHDVLFLGKMMFIFATLFGAGAYLFSRKYEGQPLSRGWGRWYLRCGWLLVFGIIHGWFIWFGDILVPYALSGMLLVWWTRRLPVWALIGLAIGLYGVGMLTMVGSFALQGMGEGQPQPYFADVFGAVLGPDMQTEAYTGPYGQATTLRIISLLFMMYPVYLFSMIWMVMGLMSLGLAAARTGFITGEKSAKTYLITALVALPLGLTITLIGRHLLKSSENEIVAMAFTAFAQILGVFTSLGYASLLLYLVKSGTLKPVTNALAAVGRMAFTNYILQSLIATTIFYGHGLALYGSRDLDQPILGMTSVDFPFIWVVMAGVWTINIALSLVWLKFFRMGPLEWLWRSLTYLKPQKIAR